MAIKKNFDVQRALNDGVPMGQIQQFMSKNGMSGGGLAPVAGNPLYSGTGSTDSSTTPNILNTTPDSTGYVNPFPSPSSPANTYSGNDDIQKLITQAKSAPDIKTATTALDFASKLQGLESTSKTAQAAQEKQDASVKSTAQKLYDLTNSSPEQKSSSTYQTDLANAASDYAAAKMGGKTPQNVPDFMAGSLPQFQGKSTGIVGVAQNLGIGNQPGKLLDPESRLRELAANDLGIKAPQDQSGTAPTQEKSFGGLLQNAGTNAKDIINGIAGAPKNLWDTANAMQNQYGTPMELLQKNPGQFAQVESQMQSAPAVGAVKEFDAALGNPEQGGDIAQRAIDRAYQKPVTTGLDALSVIKGLGGIQNGLANGSANAMAVDSAITNPEDLAAFNKAPNELQAPQGNQLPNITDRTGGITGAQSRALSAVGTPEKNDILANDQEMQKVMQIGQGNTPRDIARSLPNQISKFDKAVDGYAGQMDDAVKSGQIQPLDLQERMNTLEQQLRSSDVGQAKPAVVDQIMSQLKAQLGDPEQGDTAGYSEFNDARKFLNKNIRSGFFKNGMQLNSDADYASQMKWDASNFLKDTLAQSDPDGQIQSALDNEHAAIKAYPSMSADALSKGATTTRGIRSMLFKMGNSALNPLRVAGARNAAGPADAATQAVLGGNLPPLSGLSPQNLPPIPITFGNGMNSPDQFQMLRDNRFGQGNYWQNPNALPNIQPLNK